MDDKLSLKDFLAHRDRELDAEERPLRERLQRIVSERMELRRAAAALGTALPHQSWDLEVKLAPTRRLVPEKTIKQTVLKILGDHREGMVALDILAEVNRRLGASYPRTSLSPQLSRLKAEGWIAVDRNKWRLVAKEIPPAHSRSDDAGAQGGSSTPVKPGEGVEHENSVSNR